jgi:hypothetical protein
MSYVVYHKETTRTLNDKVYATRASARAALTRASKKDDTIVVDQYAVAGTFDFYSNIEKYVTKTCARTGKTFVERVNTPYYLSPSSETYWCS